MSAVSFFEELNRGIFFVYRTFDTISHAITATPPKEPVPITGGQTFWIKSIPLDTVTAATGVGRPMK